MSTTKSWKSITFHEWNGLIHNLLPNICHLLYGQKVIMGNWKENHLVIWVLSLVAKFWTRKSEQSNEKDLRREITDDTQVGKDVLPSFLCSSVTNNSSTSTSSESLLSANNKMWNNMQKWRRRRSSLPLCNCSINNKKLTAKGTYLHTTWPLQHYATIFTQCDYNKFDIWQL